MSKKNNKKEETTHIRIYKADKKKLATLSLKENITIADLITNPIKQL